MLKYRRLVNIPYQIYSLRSRKI